MQAGDDASADWLYRQRAGKNADAKAALLRKHEQQFATWAFELCEGFNLLMYGFGSKRVRSSDVHAQCSIRFVTPDRCAFAMQASAFFAVNATLRYCEANPSDSQTRGSQISTPDAC